MSESGTGTQPLLWTTEYMIARAEGIAAGFHKSLSSGQVYRLSRDILSFVEAARLQDAAKVATLEKALDLACGKQVELEQRTKELESQIADLYQMT